MMHHPLQHPIMLAGSVNWPLVAVLLVAHVALAYRVSFYARAMGRRQWLWFVISVLATILPITALAIWHRFGWLMTGKPDPRHMKTPRKDKQV
jgi:hypothetical protein